MFASVGLAIGRAVRQRPRLARCVATAAVRRQAGSGLQYPVREGEDIRTTRRRLLYQMRKRGILETDLLLSTFAAQHLDSLSGQELADLDALLANIDWDIFYWATGRTPPPADVLSMPVFHKLRDHASARGTSITRMPDLDQGPS
ncbi:Succinate dehydrogenase assembly factor 2 mitochondrial [Coemansia spiralis]|nr:Succinate dehydrogenase assembly factor 2 mitochondrial [Coemansia spiralis]